MQTPRPNRFAALGVVLVVACGCEMRPAELGNGPFDSPGGGPFGPPQNSPLLSPLAGRWTFDKQATIQARRAAGADAAAGDDPQPDMVITGNVAVCGGSPTPEYRFFAIHRHDGKICAKAWYHEDRFDPGDMSKCYVRFELKDDRLYFTLRMKEATPDVNDPELTTPPRVELSSEADCDADNLSSDDWDSWSTYAFVRVPSRGR